LSKAYKRCVYNTYRPLFFDFAAKLKIINIKIHNKKLLITFHTEKASVKTLNTLRKIKPSCEL
ncbi:hypothetical protein K8M07_12545, partial [Schnuerera sp. xch1]|uniref:hypothetical protein n=1 Tax=Schnuerera sp. xch1 TaxID=2874283 RepID=UPI001CC06CEE